MRRLAAVGVLALASLGLAACNGDGDVVLPSDTKPKPTTTTVQETPGGTPIRDLTCDEVRATTTTSASVAQIILCVERRR